ncbi:hypothetical protein T440DRAFT_523537 [Plenodomus tracheiphilus IPT5]|uniref:Uncharacterized protein n=1 Tax=Plenodomus tracheiphilus IPT5 TaxID=1408161 RepID=A0A6A7AMJ4_9PLEO|nr:hypothetical protein T440DRAFT_523537 [Plenodomus tracheiphilus IPT5]
MSSAFAWIKWSVFEDMSTILVKGDKGYEVLSGAGVKPFIGHPIAAEAASEIPLHEIKLTISVMDEHEGLNEKDEEYESPNPVDVRGEDGGMVTVGDVVEQLSPHFATHKKEILEFVAPMLNISPKDVLMNHKVFFNYFFGVITPGSHSLVVELWAKGEFDWSIEMLFYQAIIHN